MKLSIQNVYDDHDDIFALLPWYVNGSLDQAESTRAEAHAKVCLQCRAEVLVQQKIALRIQDTDIEALEINAGFESLRARIASHSIQQEKLSPFDKLASSAQRWAKFMRRPFALRITAIAGLVFVLAGGLMLSKYHSGTPLSSSPTGVEYQTLSAKPREAVFEREILVVFKPEVSESDITAALQKLDTAVVKARSENGVMRIAIAADNASREATLAVVKKLKRSPLIMFVEPAIASD